MIRLRDVLETVAYCAATVVIGTGALFAAGTFSAEHVGTPVVSSAYLQIPGNFNDAAVVEPGRVTDLRACDIAPETGTYYETGPCADHELWIAGL
jgi:hypothetical protein